MSTRPFSARWESDVVERLERRSRSVGTSKSRLAQRYVDEGTQMDAHPGIIFRDGPTGRRAALAAGPDVWEVIATIRVGDKRGDQALVAAAELLNLSVNRVRVATRYYSAYPEAIDQRLQRYFEDADEAEAAWRRQQAALA